MPRQIGANWKLPMSTLDERPPSGNIFPTTGGAFKAELDRATSETSQSGESPDFQQAKCGPTPATR
jgi:hypothetical protein